MAEHWGLSLIQEPENFDYVQNIVDIVFVHGLTGNHKSTWTALESGVFWPRDLLPESLPHCRILTFGYDSDWTNYSAFHGISSIAEQLLGTLAGHCGHNQAASLCSLPQCSK
jgi:hypothetical protein